MKVILQSSDDLEGQAHAARIALAEYPKGPPSGDHIGLRVNLRYYGVKWNRRSISIYPQGRQ